MPISSVKSSAFCVGMASISFLFLLLFFWSLPFQHVPALYVVPFGFSGPEAYCATINTIVSIFLTTSFFVWINRYRVVRQNSNR